MSGHKSQKKGPNIICRVSNVTPKMVCSYVERLPKQTMTEDEFRDYMGRKWFQNEHQAPEQWGLYYLDGTNYYPRFNHDLTIKEAEAYLYHWMRNLIVINPYTRFKKPNDKNLVEAIVGQLEKNSNEHDLKTIIRRIIDSDEPFVINEIIANALNNYSRVLKVEIINKDEERFNVSLLPNHKDLLNKESNMTKKEYFELFDSVKTSFNPNVPLQQIFYGAPGTGKSNTIKKVVDDNGQINFRTTFHPDSDYSTFVGAYKPTMGLGKVYGAQGPLKDGGKDIEESKIVYKFTPQAFAKAYVTAWKTTQNVYLIIEEINRGNCAQIFGDLFQLLDRKNGVSEYPIDADADIASYIEDKLNGGIEKFNFLSERHLDIIKNNVREEIPEDVRSGRRLMLPSNLYIWATMNTSDQSLFPIDSAFKRRWDWIYIPIKPHDDENYKIEIGTSVYDWWGFLEKINQVIDDTTSSEDKKLGYFFVKAEDEVVKADKFVGKVLFYLWNDVFKNYGFDNPIFCKGENKKFTFSDFFQKDGSPNTEMVNMFLRKLDETIDKENSFEVIQDAAVPSSSLMVKYKGKVIEGSSARSKYVEIVKQAVEEKGGDQVAKCLGSNLTRTPAVGSTRNFRPIGESGWQLATNNGIDVFKRDINKLKNDLGIDIEIE